MAVARVKLNVLCFEKLRGFLGGGKVKMEEWMIVLLFPQQQKVIKFKKKKERERNNQQRESICEFCP